MRRIAGVASAGGSCRACSPGDRLDVEVPLGNFALRKEDYRPLLMVATAPASRPSGHAGVLMDDPDRPPVWALLGHAVRRI